MAGETFEAGDQGCCETQMRCRTDVRPFVLGNMQSHKAVVTTHETEPA